MKRILRERLAHAAEQIHDEHDDKERAESEPDLSSGKHLDSSEVCFGEFSGEFNFHGPSPQQLLRHHRLRLDPGPYRRLGYRVVDFHLMMFRLRIQGVRDAMYRSD